MVYKWLRSIQNFLFPARCRLCLAPGADHLELCPGCILDLPRIRFACLRCGRPTPLEDTPLCGNCLAEPPAYDRCLALFAYDYPVDYLIHQIKYGEDLALARSLGRLLLAKVKEHPEPLPHRLVPVPLHRKRLAERGYNQALELARPFGNHGFNLDSGCCIRSRATAEQAGLPAAQRSKNVKNAFEATKQVPGEHIALIDDVLTTGSTLSELAKTLKQAGAFRVDVWVVARTLQAPRQ